MNPVPFVTGAPWLVKLLAEELPGITSVVLHREHDVSQAGENMVRKKTNGI